MFKGISEVVGESSLLGLVVAGTAVIVLAPTVKNILRGVAVGTAKGVLSLVEGGESLASTVKQGWDSVVAEAKTQKGMAQMDAGTTIGAGAGGAIGATLGGSMGGTMGAALGGGLGGVMGASVGSGIKTETDPN
ncbi:MAG: hypothetical protein M0T74_11300 [Desulfitobacterium hafniense]|nr:hypothetical protein [Desulfitobacterium hafniense]